MAMSTREFFKTVVIPNHATVSGLYFWAVSDEIKDEPLAVLGWRITTRDVYEWDTFNNRRGGHVESRTDDLVPVFAEWEQLDEEDFDDFSTWCLVEQHGERTVYRFISSSGRCYTLDEARELAREIIAEKKQRIEARRARYVAEREKARAT